MKQIGNGARTGPWPVDTDWLFNDVYHFLKYMFVDGWGDSNPLRCSTKTGGSSKAEKASAHTKDIS